MLSFDRGSLLKGTGRFHIHISTQVSGPALGASADLLLLKWDLSQEMKERWNLKCCSKAASQQEKKKLYFTFMEKREAKRLPGKLHTVAFIIPLSAHSYIWLQAV